MTSQGHAVSTFARTMKTGNPNRVIAAAPELPRLSLADPLLVLLVFARARAPQTEAAAVKWAARYVAEIRPAPRAHETHLVLSAPCALARPCPTAGQEALHALRAAAACSPRRLDEFAHGELRSKRVRRRRQPERRWHLLAVGWPRLSPVCAGSRASSGLTRAALVTSGGS